MNLGELPSAARVDIVGGGLIGLACGLAISVARPKWRLTVWDPGPREHAASWAAAGMIAPAHELLREPNGCPLHVDLALASRRLWPGFADRLRAFAAMDPGLDVRPSWLASCNRTETEELRRLLTASRSAGFAGQLHEADALPAEVRWAGGVEAVAELSSDIQVDNRALLTALSRAAERSGVQTCGERYAPERSDADLILVAAGWQTARLGRWLGSTVRQISPVKGQLLALAANAEGVPRVVRHGSIYIAPKPDRIVVGATVEPGRSDLDLLATAQDALQEAAARVVPALADAPVITRWAGVRPATPDGAPLVGRVEGADRPTLIAAGHYRNGVLLAPVTAALALHHLGIDPQDAGFPADLAATLASLARAWNPARFEASLASSG
jgi:glycine oxidase